MTALEVALRGRIPPPPRGGSPRTERSPLHCGHLPTPWGVTFVLLAQVLCDWASPHPVGSHPFQGRLYVSLQTPYKIKLPACTRKHLNINITDTGKGNNRRWQAQADNECNERIPPDGFDMAALEVALRGAMWAFSLPISRKAPVYLQSPKK